MFEGSCSVAVCRFGVARDIMPAPFFKAVLVSICRLELLATSSAPDSEPLKADDDNDDDVSELSDSLPLSLLDDNVDSDSSVLEELYV